MKKKKIAKKSSLFTQIAQRIVIQWLICVKTYLRSSQVFTGLHGKVSYFRFSQLKSENGKGVMRREGMWRVGETLHTYIAMYISSLNTICEEWRLILRICEREIFFPHEGKIKTSRGKNNDKLLAYRNSSKYRSNLNSHENLGVSYR